jgi:prophage antirepressor-like protein
MNELNQVFAFNHNAEEPCVIRVLGTRENPLFPATDVCRALGLTQITRALKGIDEQYLTFGKVVDSNGRERKTNCLTEIGLYLLTFRSNKPRA